jgi:hypothetical protein
MSRRPNLDDVLKELQKEKLLDEETQLGLVRGGAEAMDSCHQQWPWEQFPWGLGAPSHESPVALPGTEEQGGRGGKGEPRLAIGATLGSPGGDCFRLKSSPVRAGAHELVRGTRFG